MRSGCCAWLLLFACGRLGFEPADRQTIADGPADASLYCYDATCADSFTCCEPAGVRCVQDPADCQGQVGQCRLDPPAGCSPSELCCILSSAPYFQCVPENAGIC